MLHGQACLTGRSVRSAVPKTWQAARSRAFKAVRAESATKKKVGFRWDGANLRWVKDERFADLAQDPDKTLIKPRTGTPYQVRTCRPGKAYPSKRLIAPFVASCGAQSVAACCTTCLFCVSPAQFL